MGTILPLKQLIQRKQKHYKSAIEDHLVTLKRALDDDTRQKLQQLEQRSIAITVPDYDDDGDDGDDDDARTIINGFKVENLPDSKLEERVILIESDTQQQVARGSIVDIGENCQVKIRLDKPLAISKNSDEADSMCSNGSVFKIKFDEQDILNRKNRIENALRKFEQVSCSLSLHKSLLGNYKDLYNNKFGKSRAISLSESLQLKGSQLEAVQQSMRKRISLIEGVAGSGKTLVAASLAYSMSRLRGKRILLCSPIQATVDKLAKLLTSAEGNVLVVKLGEKKKTRANRFAGNRCSSGQKSSLNSEESCTLDSLVRAEIFKRSWRRLTSEASFAAPRTHRGPRYLSRQANKMATNSSTWLKKRVEHKILSRADIVCCTLVQAGSPCLKGLNFDMLIVDDLQAAPETDCMIPMMASGLKQVTLISEMRREIRSARSKRPSFDVVSPEPTKNRRANGLLKTKAANSRDRDLVIKQAQEPGGLFERLLSMGLSTIALRNQFRMHETLAAFSNHHFYLSRLKTDQKTNRELTRQISSDPETSSDKFKWLPNSRCLTAFFDTSTTSVINETAKKIVDMLVLNENIDKSRIGIIINENYGASKSGFDGNDIGTVEDFLGQERDFVILMATNGDTDNNNDSRNHCEHSSTLANHNYLMDEDALLIAITRARLGLFIVSELTRELKEPANDGQTQTRCQITDGVSQTNSFRINYCESWKALVKYYMANKLVVQKLTESGY